MPSIQTILFEDVDIDVQSNKLLCLHPIQRYMLSQPLPVTVGFSVLSCAYDLPPGTYVCKHTLISDKKKEIASVIHKPAALLQEGGISFRSAFEGVEIPAYGRYAVRTEVGRYKGEEVALRFDAANPRARTQPIRTQA